MAGAPLHGDKRRCRGAAAMRPVDPNKRRILHGALMTFESTANTRACGAAAPSLPSDGSTAIDR